MQRKRPFNPAAATVGVGQKRTIRLCCRAHRAGPLLDAIYQIAAFDLTDPAPTPENEFAQNISRCARDSAYASYGAGASKPPVRNLRVRTHRRVPHWYPLWPSNVDERNGWAPHRSRRKGPILDMADATVPVGAVVVANDRKVDRITGRRALYGC